MSHKAYPEYKDSGVEWLGEVPGYWKILRLKHIATAFPSNIDKKAYEDEEAIRLCNYVDVYHNEEIREDLAFMEATATRGQIEKFVLRAGDTIITKDSETADDIAIASYVPMDIPGVVCGYHLTMVRPRKGYVGRFIKRLFDSRFLKSQFEVAARGLTRVGLSQYAIDNILVTSPPANEQSAIVAFLDRETAKIDALVAEQEKLIELLKEKRQAVISHAVTNGLDQNAPMKDSGVEWLGEVPEHWEVGAIKHFFEFLDGKRIPLSGEERSSRSGEYPYYGASGIIDWIDDFIFDEDLVLVSEDGANLACRSTPISFIARGKYWVNNHAHILRPIDEALVYWAERVEAIDLTPVISGSAQPKLTSESLANIKISVPPTYEERHAIQCFISQEVGGIDDLLAEAQRAIDLLKERRVALISAAVTGKIDVRGLAGAV